MTLKISVWCLVTWKTKIPCHGGQKAWLEPVCFLSWGDTVLTLIHSYEWIHFMCPFSPLVCPYICPSVCCPINVPSEEDLVGISFKMLHKSLLGLKDGLITNRYPVLKRQDHCGPIHLGLAIIHKFIHIIIIIHLHNTMQQEVTLYTSKVTPL